MNLSLAGLPPSSAASWLSSLDLHSEFSFAFSWFYTLLFTCDQSAFQISTSETLTSCGCTKLYVVDSRVYNLSFSQHGHHQNSKSIIMIGDTLICVRLSFFCSLAQLRLGRLWSLFEEEEECSFLLVIIPTSSHLKLCEIFNVGNSTTHCSWQDGWLDLLSGTGWLKILIYYCLYIYGTKCKRLLLKHMYISVSLTSWWPFIIFPNVHITDIDFWIPTQCDEFNYYRQLR